MTMIKILDAELPFKLEWLRTLVAVADAGGFTRAARRLGMSQAAVSTHVKELETNLGTRLFERIGGRVRLTRPGEAAVREGRATLEGVRAFKDVVAETEGGMRGVLAVAASTTPGNYLLPPLLGAFERAHPGVRTRLWIGNSARVLERLSAGDADVGFTGVDPSSDSLLARPVWDDDIVPFVAPDHPLARKRSPDPSRERLLLREADSATRRLAEEWLSKRKGRPEVLDLGCPETVKRAAAAGLGIGVLSRFALAWELEEGRLVRLKLPGFPLRRKLYVVRRRRKRASRLLEAFLGALPRVS
jgi:LysR family transcriptional regulator, low CO2-responsive transcriptional regulator